MHRVALAIALVFALGLLPASVSAAQKVTICHAQPGDTAADGWVRITVAGQSLYTQNGHFEQHDADIIPPNPYGPSKNWNTAGQAVYDNGCVLPPPPRPPVEPIDPPTPPPKRLGVSGIVCGDPRVVIASISTYRTTLRVRFVDGRTGQRRTVSRVAPRGFKAYHRFWVKGRTVFKVWGDGRLLFKTRTGAKQNTGACRR